MFPGLSLAQAPPPDVPLRFLLTAPLFGVGSGLWLLAEGPTLLADRWMPQTLGATHLLTLGVLTMVMVGALFQMLPVVAGAPLTAVRGLGRLVHAALATGSLALATGLASGRHQAVLAALVLLLCALAPFIVAVAAALLRAPRVHPTVRGMRLALAGLTITATLGGLLGLGHADPAWPLWRTELTSHHLAWGLLGWTGLLLLSVAYQVVPMFQLTPEYPAPLARWTAPALFTALLGWSLLELAGPVAFVRHVVAALACLVLVAAAIATLVLLGRRQRRRPDATLDCWRLSMLSLLAAIALYWLQPAAPALATIMVLALLAGFALSAVNGMLYKIVPFLCWLHLQAASLRAGGGHRLPGMRSLLPERRTRLQVAVHGLALGALLAAPLWPLLARPAGALFALSQLLLAANLARVVRACRGARRELVATGD